MNQKYRLVTLMVVLVSFTGANAQQMNRKAAVVRALAGTSEKEWVFTRWRKHMGAANSCEAGESYVFRTNGTVEWRQCVSEQVRRTVLNWRLEFPTTLDTRITIGSSSYILVLAEGETRRAIEQMKLRRPSADKVTPTVDLVYRHIRSNPTR